MTSGRTIDFDAFRAEQTAEPVTILIGGETYVLSADMPAEVALEVIALRNEYGEQAELPVEKIDVLAKSLFGADLLETLVKKHRLTANELAALIVQVFTQYDRALVPNPTAPKKTGQKKRASTSR